MHLGTCADPSCPNWARVKELEAEIERMKDHIEDSDNRTESIVRQRDQAEAEVKRLKAHIELNSVNPPVRGRGY